MSMRLRPALIPLLMTMAGLLLAACGQQPAAAPTALPSAAAPAAAPTDAPAAAAPTLAAATSAPAPTLAASTPSAAPADDLATIAQGRTAEGYQALGAEGAPVTMVMYSDFL
jgi:hypothetical protein